MGDDDDTPDLDPTVLNGYGVGFREGYRIAMVRFLDCFRRALIEDGTDPGSAADLASKLARWIEHHGG